MALEWFFNVRLHALAGSGFVPNEPFDLAKAPRVGGCWENDVGVDFRNLRQDRLAEEYVDRYAAPIGTAPYCSKVSPLNVS